MLLLSGTYACEGPMEWPQPLVQHAALQSQVQDELTAYRRDAGGEHNRRLRDLLLFCWLHVGISTWRLAIIGDVEFHLLHPFDSTLCFDLSNGTHQQSGDPITLLPLLFHASTSPAAVSTSAASVSSRTLPVRQPRAFLPAGAVRVAAAQSTATNVNSMCHHSGKHGMPLTISRATNS